MIAKLTDEQAATLYERVKVEYEAQVEASERHGIALTEVHAAKVESNIAWPAFVTACGDLPTALGLMEWLADKGEK